MTVNATNAALRRALVVGASAAVFLAACGVPQEVQDAMEFRRAAVASGEFVDLDEQCGDPTREANLLAHLQHPPPWSRAAAPEDIMSAAPIEPAVEWQSAGGHQPEPRWCFIVLLHHRSPFLHRVVACFAGTAAFALPHWDFYDSPYDPRAELPNFRETAEACQLRLFSTGKSA